MKHLPLLSLVLSMGTLGIAHQAPPPPPASGQPPRMQYDLSQEQTLQGTVAQIQTRGQGPMNMVMLTFTVASGSRTVCVGPEGMLARRGLALAVGDALTILGASTQGPDGEVFMARTVTREGTTVDLLDSQGQPIRASH